MGACNTKIVPEIPITESVDEYLLSHIYNEKTITKYQTNVLTDETTCG